MTSTYDHRIIQGAESGRFLARIDEYLQGQDGFYEAVFSSLGAALPPLPETVAPAAAAAPALAPRQRPSHPAHRPMSRSCCRPFRLPSRC